MSQWGIENVVNFYLSSRNSYKDLYNSEKKPLLKIKKNNINNILDFGCAAGGFYKIFKSLFKKIKYHGLDTEPNIIRVARIIFKKNKNVKFSVVKKKNLGLRDNSYSLAFCTGVLNHNVDYKKIIDELLRVSSKYIFIDSPRVHSGKSFIGKLDLTKRFPSKFKKKNIVNNYTINLENYLKFLKKSFVKNNVKKVYFYYDRLPYKKKYLNINKKIFFLTFLCEKDINSSQNLDYSLVSKNKSVLKIFEKVFG